MLIGGNSHQAQLNELSGWLSGTANESWAKEAGDGIKGFVQLKISTSNAEEKAANDKTAERKGEGKEDSPNFDEPETNQVR